MKILVPGDVQTQADGRFPCGRKAGFEKQVFKMPSTSCSDCVIQMTYFYNDTAVSYCSDIVLT